MAGDSKTPLIPVSVVLVIMAALGVTLFVQPFKGGRPSVSEYRESYERVNARLWQDPFQAVVDSIKEGQAPEDVGQLSDDTALNTREERPFKSSYLNDIQGKDMVTVLAVMVPGNPYFEGTETRMRYRYALLSGLKRVGYVSKDAEHIEFIRTRSRGNKITLSNIIPVEWLSHEKDNDEVLVLWINDDVFERTPLSKLARVVAYIKRTKKLQNTKVEVNIIGPAISGTLKNMVSEVGSHQKLKGLRPLEGVQIFSPWATVGSVLLVKPVPTEIKTEDDALRDIKKNFEHQGITLVRTIGPDQALVLQLVSELQNRQADLCDDKNHLLLVAEWDTFYARSFRNLFIEALKMRGVSEEKADPRIHFISYLRGIDGSLPGEKGDSDKKDPKADAKSDPLSDVKKLEQPIGKSQYDYLRRLAGATYNLNQKLRAEETKGRIVAVGVMGSDFYDKYLVLQALRQEFSDLIFFTTDLDARFLHPDNIKWTRNVIVASNFDLSLREDLQGEIPAFRDNYQTSAFLTVLRVFADKWSTLGEKEQAFLEGFVEEVPNEAWSKPIIFEIGRYKAVRLTETYGTVHPQKESRECDIWFSWTKVFIIPLGLAIIAFVSIPFNSTMKRFFHVDTSYVLGASAGAMLLGGVAYFVYYAVRVSASPNEEPFSIIEGMSVWPTELLRLLAVMLTILFICVSCASLKANRKLIDDKLFIGDSDKLLKEDEDARKEYTHSWIRMVVELDWAPRKPEGERGLKGLWLEYISRSRTRYRAVRLALVILIYIIIGWLIVGMDLPPSPLRGSTSGKVDQRLLVVSAVSLVLLIFFVVDVTRCCRRFIMLASNETAALNRSCSTRRDKINNELDLMRLVALRTEPVGKLIFYPFIVWLIMFVARFDYFDRWSTPPVLVIVICLGALLAWSSAFLLRRSAEKTRTRSVGRLRELLRTAKKDETQDATLTGYIQFAIDEVESIRTGAFLPFTQHPVLQSLLVPFGGVGGIYLVDFLAKMNF